MFSTESNKHNNKGSSLQLKPNNNLMKRLPLAHSYFWPQRLKHINESGICIIMNPIRKIINWYFTRGALPYWCILALDCTSVFVSGLVVYYIRYGGLSLAQHFWPIVFGLLVSLLVFVVSFFAFHTFRGVIRYSSFVDLHRLAYSTICACAVVCLLHQVQVHTTLTPYILFPSFESAIFIIATSMMWALRVFVKGLHDSYRSSTETKNVFIYGCMTGGVALAKSIQNSIDCKYHLSGFISGDLKLDGTWLLGVPVHYDTDAVVQKMQEKNASVLLVSPIQSQRFTNRPTLINALIKANIQIMMMPPAEEWDGKSDLSHNQLREVEIEDLLPRQKIEVDMDAIGNMLHSKRILITGAAGSIGSEMARQVAKFQPAELVLVDQAETPMASIWQTTIRTSTCRLSLLPSARKTAWRRFLPNTNPNTSSMQQLISTFL